MAARKSSSLFADLSYSPSVFRKQVIAFLCWSALFFFYLQGSVHGVNFREIAAASSLRDDHYLISIIHGSDYDQALSVCVGLSSRQEKNVQSIIFSLLDTARGKEAYRSEHLMRVLIDGLIASASDDHDREMLIQANAEAFDSLMHSMNSFRDCVLKANLIVLFRLSEKPRYAPIIAKEGSMLVETMRRHKGHLSPEERAEAFAFLEYCSTADSKVFMEICSTFAEESRDKELVKRAKQILRKAFSNR